MIRTKRFAIALVMALATASWACEEGGGAGSCEIGCPEGERYPCPCSAGMTCGDDSVCGTVDDSYTVGFCSIPCESDADCVLDWDCTGVGKCVLDNVTSGGKNCALTCGGDDDCPFYMECIGFDGLKVCYPIMD